LDRSIFRPQNFLFSLPFHDLQLPSQTHLHPLAALLHDTSHYKSPVHYLHQPIHHYPSISCIHTHWPPPSHLQQSPVFSSLSLSPLLHYTVRIVNIIPCYSLSFPAHVHQHLLHSMLVDFLLHLIGLP
jgi:hypothetical protein